MSYHAPHKLDGLVVTVWTHNQPACQMVGTVLCGRVFTTSITTHALLPPLPFDSPDNLYLSSLNAHLLAPLTLQSTLQAHYARGVEAPGSSTQPYSRYGVPARLPLQNMSKLREISPSWHTMRAFQRLSDRENMSKFLVMNQRLKSTLGPQHAAPKAAPCAAGHHMDKKPANSANGHLILLQQSMHTSSS